MQDSQNLERVVLSFDKFDIPAGKQINKWVVASLLGNDKEFGHLEVVLTVLPLLWGFGDNAAPPKNSENWKDDGAEK